MSWTDWWSPEVGRRDEKTHRGSWEQQLQGPWNCMADTWHCTLLKPKPITNTRIWPNHKNEHLPCTVYNHLQTETTRVFPVKLLPTSSPTLPPSSYLAQFSRCHSRSCRMPYGVLRLPLCCYVDLVTGELLLSASILTFLDKTCSSLDCKYYHVALFVQRIWRDYKCMPILLSSFCNYFFWSWPI